MDWGMVFTYYLPVGVVYGSLFCIVLSELAACFQRWRSHGAGLRAAEHLLDSVRDAPYLPLPGGPPPPPSSSSCVICLAEYGRGEGRFVLPGCGHAFHRACIAEWLRLGKRTCPICRAVAVVVPPAGHEFGVVRATAAEDMV